MTIEDIKKQSFFKTQRERIRGDVGARTASWAARQLLDNIKPFKIWRVTVNWKAKVMNQPFYGKEKRNEPDMIKLRRPVPYIAAVAQDAIAYGMGVSQNGERINPRDVWDMETPVYTLEDICWKRYGAG